MCILGTVNADTKVSLKQAAAGLGSAAATRSCVLSACTSSSAMLTTSSWARGRGPQERNASEREEQMSLTALAAAVTAADSADSAAAMTQVKTRKVRRLPSSSGRRMAEAANDTGQHSHVIAAHCGTAKMSSKQPKPCLHAQSDRWRSTTL